MAAVVGYVSPANLARDRAWLLLAVVFRFSAKNLARPARSRVCTGFDLQSVMARVSSRAAVMALAGGHDRDYRSLGAKPEVVGGVTYSTTGFGRQRLPRLGGAADRHV